MGALAAVARRVKSQVQRRQLRGDKVECPVCAGTFSRFVDVRGRENVGCPKCGSLERHRQMWLYLRDHEHFAEAMRVLHFAPERMFRRLLTHDMRVVYTAVDLHPTRPDTMQADVQDLPFDDCTFDRIICIHVLEHVPDDRQGLREMYRVLKPGGRAILQHPESHEIAQTLEDPNITSEEDRLRVYGHEDHRRLYGADIIDRIREAGFTCPPWIWQPSTPTSGIA